MIAAETPINVRIKLNGCPESDRLSGSFCRLSDTCQQGLEGLYIASMDTANQHGFTIYELLITMLIIGIVMSIAVPNLSDFTKNSRITSVANDLHSSFHLARSEAARSKSNITICASTNSMDAAAACGGTFDDGWMMFVNLDRDAPAVRDPDEPVLQRYSVSLHNQITANRRSFSFRTTALRATNGTFIFCDKARRAAPRALVVSYTGRPRVTRHDRRGNPYNCPD